MAKSSVVPWSFKLEKGEKITKILVIHDFVVEGIGFEITKDGKVIKTNWYEGTGAKSHTSTTSEVPLLDGDNLTHISGTYGYHLGEVCITTMTIHTDLFPEGHGQYCDSKEPSEVTPFSSPLPIDGSIDGFFGCTETFLGSIGIYASGKKITKYGPYGDKESKLNWYIKLKEGDMISSITIWHAYVVDGIGFEVKNIISGKIYSQEFHGPEEKFNTITFDEHEKITKVTGSFGNYHDKGIKIATIKIYTDSRPKGIGYGSEADFDANTIEKFEYHVTPKSSLVRFYGSYGMFLNSIGFGEEFAEEHNYGPYGRII
ncbi:uncharacterized protein LOC110723932 [Chenopodium quinoa]|uniref:uncharacterized protein LOC110723932 n=1 Tax=Chenopodium quinoa TaxID=63459 RepID=UPI000B76BDD7|nr:uncharacterized protein LOC110723932 [Chenopodium quinoa]